MSRDDSRSKAPLASDRPDFTESSTNVKKGHLQFESGYTYFHDRAGRSTQQDHSCPELLLRYGIFADWLELRRGQNFAHTLLQVDQPSRTDAGAQDLYLGLDVALFERRGFMPELKFNLQTFVPTGDDAYTGKQMLPGINVLYGWDLSKDKWTLRESSQINRRANNLNGYYWESAQSLTTGVGLTEKLGLYLESFALFPSGAHDPAIGPQYYLDGGFTYLLRENLPLDIGAGPGLNRNATDFFTGAGFLVKF